MNGFQIFAIALLLGVVVLDWVRAWQQSSWRIGVVIRSAIWLSACGFILFPDALTYLAQVLGIGRGADILLYGLTLAFLAVSFALYARIVQLRRQMTQLVRHLALAHPLPPLSSNSMDSPSCTSSSSPG